MTITAAVAVVALLTGCSGTDDDALPAMPFDTVEMPAQTAPTATPGQQLAAGDIVTLPITDPTGEPDDPIETTVIGVAQGDASYWEQFDNGEQFAGETPFFAVMQYRWVTGDVSASSVPLLRPLLDDGSEGDIVEQEFAGSLTSDAPCPFEIGRFDLEEDRGPNEYIGCVLYTAPEGSTLAGLQWHNLSPLAFSEPDPAVNPFYTAPVVWEVTPLVPDVEG
ncbi:hypothetical protein [Conyzicola lurida]|uniref:hypothetical protein n=1 Tax=Conyzicola lurida TaxID=1172621 RepID=UPI00161F60E7|nr:hypothetical protein [Conyzicola lurida]